MAPGPRRSMALHSPMPKSEATSVRKSWICCRFCRGPQVENDLFLKRELIVRYTFRAVNQASFKGVVCENLSAQEL